jgi:hypothetical protein
MHIIFNATYTLTRHMTSTLIDVLCLKYLIYFSLNDHIKMIVDFVLLYQTVMQGSDLHAQEQSHVATCI